MLCSHCSEAERAAPSQLARLRPTRLDPAWTRLTRLICHRCGAVLPGPRPDPDPSAKASQLARFGLRTDGDTLLEP